MEDKESWLSKFEECYASERFITQVKRLDLHNIINIQEIEKAIYYARKYHGTQMRQSGEPYYYHTVEEVAYIASSYFLNTNVFVTSILHDALEDTKLTFEMISDIFGSVIAGQVQDLTRIKFDGTKITAGDTVNLLFAQHKKDILHLKLFDRLHNMRTIGAKSPEKAKKIIEETFAYFVPLAVYLRIPKITQELIKLGYENLQVKLEDKLLISYLEKLLW